MDKMTVSQMEMKKIKEGTKDSWQWHLTFIGQHMAHNYYLYYILDKIMEENPQLRGVVEIGTGHGALTMALGLWGIKRELSVITLDVKRMFSAPIFKALGIKFYRLDERSPEAKDLIFEFVKNVPVLFICDGGDKIWEFNTWAPQLKIDSVICIHDYGIEVTYADIEAVIKNDYLPYRLEDWFLKNIQFAMFRRVLKRD